jgi:hypothetical protein
MIDHTTLEKLREKLSVHGVVRNLMPIAKSELNPSCLILATMGTPKAAMELQSRYGFTSFGYDAVIINEQWLRAHLVDD